VIRRAAEVAAALMIFGNRGRPVKVPSSGTFLKSGTKYHSFSEAAALNFLASRDKASGLVGIIKRSII
jgi:hypothetical protein